MKKYFPLLLIAIAVFLTGEQFDLIPGGGDAPTQATQTEAVRDNGQQAISRAFKNEAENVPVQGSGQVEHVLSDDTRGSQHQRFILALGNGQTVMVAHNIDLAPRVPDLRDGDTIAFKGIYEWNDKGGVIHWTHRDPDGSHPGGWLEHDGQRYE